MAPHKVEQRRLVYRDRLFHFVAYEGIPANERRSQPAVPPMWHLMNEGKRYPVTPHLLGQPLEDLDASLLRWVEERIFAPQTPQA